MQAILKSKHQEFLDWINDVKIQQPVLICQLTELENEVELVYNEYQQKVQELKLLIQAYQEKQKTIQNEIRKTKKNGLFGRKVRSSFYVRR